MIGTQIIISTEPQGKFIEGIVSGTPKPGTFMEVVPAVARTQAGWKWRASTKTTGNPRNIVVLLEDKLQGKIYSDAYEDATKCFLYRPTGGEIIHGLVLDVAGTGSTDIHAVGDLMAINNAGKLVADAAYTFPQLTLKEAVGPMTADTLAAVMVND